MTSAGKKKKSIRFGIENRPAELRLGRWGGSSPRGKTQKKGAKTYWKKTILRGKPRALKKRTGKSHPERLGL